MKIYVIVNFARSGGTLLTQLLNTYEGAWVFSEINALAGVTSDHEVTEPEFAIINQAQQWFNLAIKNRDGLLNVVKELADAAASRNKTLVIRDWSFQNFVRTKQNRFNPSCRFELLACLRAAFDVVPLAFVRDGIDVFLSRGGDLEKFSKDYHSYVSRISEELLPILKYENLVANPYEFENDLSRVTGVDWKIDFNSFKSSPATGNLQLGKASRGNRKKGVSAIPRKRVSRPLISDIESSGMLLEANRMMNYSDLYWNGRVESVLRMAARRSFNLLRRYRKAG